MIGISNAAIRQFLRNAGAPQTNADICGAFDAPEATTEIAARMTGIAKRYTAYIGTTKVGKKKAWFWIAR